MAQIKSPKSSFNVVNSDVWTKDVPSGKMVFHSPRKCQQVFLDMPSVPKIVLHLTFKTYVRLDKDIIEIKHPFSWHVYIISKSSGIMKYHDNNKAGNNPVYVVTTSQKERHNHRIFCNIFHPQSLVHSL